MILTPTILNMLKHALILAVVGGALAFLQIVGADPLVTGASPVEAGLIGMVLAALTRLVQAESTKLDPPVTPPAPVSLPTGQGIGANMTTGPTGTSTP